MTTEEFIKKAKDKHGDRYDYGKLVYVKSTEKVEIVCSKHGSFWQTPHKHNQGCGCQKCAIDIIKKKATGNINKFLDKAKSIHNNKYGYEKVVYISAKEPITIVCPIHGDFKQTPDSHLRGCGCTKCSNQKTSERMLGNKKVSVQKFIDRANSIHKNKYDYSKVVFQKTQEKIDIVCPQHGTFKLTVNKHLLGKECPKCTMHGRVQNGWNTSAWEKAGVSSKNFVAYSIYIIKCTKDEEQFYKIGKTFRSIGKRIKKIEEVGYTVELLEQIVGTASDISKKEKDMHKQNRKAKYVPTVFFCGCQECYTEVIL